MTTRTGGTITLDVNPSGTSPRNGFVHMTEAVRLLEEQPSGKYPLGSAFCQHDRTNDLHRTITRYIAMGLNDAIIR